MDVDAEAIEWVGKHLPEVDARPNPPHGPAPFDDDSFDFLCSISIFTHLTNAASESGSQRSRGCSPLAASSDRIGYDKKSGALYYDSDGNGAHAAVQIATLQKNLKGISNKDFFVI